MRVLVVDDEHGNREILKQLLEHTGYQVTTAKNGREAVELVKNNFYDVILMDVNMPEMDGIEAVRRIRELGSHSVIIMVTSYDDLRTMEDSASVGADDFITKPVDFTELIAKLHMIKENMEFHRLKAKKTSETRKKIQELYEISEKLMKENRSLMMELIKILHNVAEYRDDETHEHTVRVGWVSGKIAKAMGFDEDYVTEIRLAAPFHDLGKVGISDSILLKPGKLTDEEYEKMKTHTLIGYNILKNASSSILKKAAIIALTHHERWNGSGYPKGLKENEIPVEGMITAVSDSLDAMVSKRVYKKAMPFEKALEEIKSLSGILYSPDVVEAFKKVEDEIRAFYEERYT